MEEKKVYLIGIGMGSAKTRTEHATECIKESDLLIGATRMLEAVSDLYDKDSKTCYNAYLSKEIGEYLRTHDFKKAAILMSGDIGFYSGAKKLVSELSDFYVELVPGITSMVYLASRLRMSWEDICFDSAHGKKTNLIQRIARHKKTFFLLDGEKGLHNLCEKLIYYKMTEVTLYVGEDLSYPEEKLVSGSPEEIRKKQFGKLVVVLVKNPSAKNWAALSIPDKDFLRAKVPMTKSEVRTICVGKLNLEADSVLYDVGAGSGSVSIEAALQSPDIQVYAIEKNPEALELLKQNKQKFAADNMEVIGGTAPEALKGLETPTHAFIGGSSGNMEEILNSIYEANPRCRIVITTIALNTLTQVYELLEKHKEYESEIVQIQSATAKKVGAYQMMMGQNPIYIISINRSEEEPE